MKSDKYKELQEIANLDPSKIQITEDDRLVDLNKCTDEGVKNLGLFLRAQYELEREILRTDLIYQANVKKWNKEVMDKLN